MKLANNPLFSVLMANYNNASYIMQSIQSVIDQTYKHWELIIVDDHSTDGSAEILSSMDDERIHIYYEDENRGVGFTKRKAVERAKGEILGFLDPDDTLTPDAIKKMVIEHRSSRDAAILYSDHFVCDNNLRVIRKSYGACEIPSNQNYLTFGKGITQFATFKSEKYQLTPGIDPDFIKAVDQDLYYKLEEVGEVKYIDEPLYYYRVHKQGISSYDHQAEAKRWALKAKRLAYERRIRTNFRNISLKSIKKFESLIEATEASRHLNGFGLASFIALFIRAVRIYPYNLLMADFYKALFLNSWFHRVISRSRKG